MDTFSLIRRAEKVSDEKIKEAEEKLRKSTCFKNITDTEKLKKTIAMYIALREFCEEKDWKAVNVKCQYELSKEYKVTPCVSLSLLADDGVTATCEGDMLCTVSMILMQYLTGDTVWYGDSLTHWDNTVQFSPCGYMPISMAKGTPEVVNFNNGPGFAGIHMCGVLRPEKITWMRIVEDIGSYHIVYGTGKGVETSPRGGDQPALNVVLDGNIEDFCKEYAGQHFAVAYGDLSADIEMYANLMGIEARRV